MNFCQMHFPYSLNYCATIIKLCIILLGIITTCIELSFKILVASVKYVIRFSSEVLQLLVQELQDLFTLAKAILIMMQQMISGHYCSKDTTAAYASLLTLLILFLVLMYG